MTFWYDKIPAPAKRCENCANGTVHPEWKDVYRCGLDGELKDYRVHCDQYRTAADDEQRVKDGRD